MSVFLSAILTSVSRAGRAVDRAPPLTRIQTRYPVSIAVPLCPHIRERAAGIGAVCGRVRRDGKDAGREWN